MTRFADRFKRPAARVVLGVWILTTILAVVINVRAWADDPLPDPGGGGTGAASNAANAGAASAFSVDDLKKLSDNKDKPATNADLLKTLDTVGQGHIAINMVWTLLTGFLVMFMQAGFAMVETGLTRAKNVAHTMGMNFLVYAIGIIGFWALGFGLQMGGVGALATFGNDPTLSSEFVVHIGGKAFGLFGTTGFFLSPAV